MINSIDLRNLRNSEFIQFCKNFTFAVNSNDPTTLKVQTQYTAMMTKITELEALFKTATSNPITAEMEALDMRRDQAYNGIAATVGGLSYHFNPNMSNAAAALQENLKLYGIGVAKENYQSETAIIHNLVTDWQTKPELQNAVDMLGILDWVVELKTVNTDFDLKYMERNHEYGAASPENLKSKRAEAMTTYYALRNRLNALAEIEGPEAYITTMNDLNALIAQYNATLQGRTTVTDEVSPN